MPTQTNEPARASTDERDAFSVPEAAKRLGISRDLAYRLVRTGQLPSVRLGERRVLIGRVALETFLESGGR
jgi:excisionase family DNA binding protein